MKRLTVLVGTCAPAIWRAISQALAARNYHVVHEPVDERLADVPDRLEHHLAIIAPRCDRESLANARAYRERARRQHVRIVVCAAPEIREVAPAIGDHIITLHAEADPPVDREELFNALDAATRHLITILVADDEPLIRRMFEMYLTNEGYKVKTAEDGHEAIQKVRELQPDLVITDIQMPVADGYEVCRSIKESRRTAHIPVIIVSALGGELDIDKGFHAGANEYVTKPVDLHELSGRIQNIFRGIARRGRERILVVTTSQIERSILEYGLQQQGFEVEAASSGDQALERALKRPPSVMVADLLLPGQPLTEVVRTLRQSPATHDLPLMVLSSQATKIDRKTRGALNAAEYLTKPFPMERLVVSIERILGERRSNLELEREMLLQTIRTLVTTLEARDSYTRGHSESVARYTRLLSERILTNEEEIARFELSAQLHDIGKIGVPDAILLKPGRLTDEEMRIMKTHPTVGTEILGPIESLKDILPGVRWHHERIDGKGYPDALPGDEIPLMARLLSVADAFDAITSDRPYRKGRTIEQGLDIVHKVAGTQLDPDIVKVFDDVVAEVHGIRLGKVVVGA